MTGGPNKLEPEPTVECAVEPVPEDAFVNRDLSWLEFNGRVLHEAEDDRTPLLERVRFLEIFKSNLDEFFMKRVGLLRSRAAEARAAGTGSAAALPSPSIAAAVEPLRTSGFDAPLAPLAPIRQAVNRLLGRAAECLVSEIVPRLQDAGVRLLRWDALSEAERDEANQFFRNTLFPILTPLAVDPGHPFPFISNLSESLAVVLRHPDHPGENLFARIKVPQSLPRWIQLQTGGTAAPAAAAAPDIRFFSTYDVIRNNLDALFPGMQVADAMLFRVTRNAELDLDEDDEEFEDLRAMVEQELKERRFANVVRIEHGPNPDPWVVQFLVEEMGLTDADVYEVPQGIEYQDLRPVADLNIPRFHFDPWTPVVPPALADEDADIFGLIRAGNILVHHPYESFTASVERFVRAAAADPRVLAIKMTLYRTGEDSPFIPALIRAAEANKQVVCLVELKARFDEQRNIQLARRLEEAGVHVVYGLVGLKTHTKTILVVRQDADRIRCYAHIGTGNYNVATARLYTDLGLLTADPSLTGDLVELFHHLTGRSLRQDYRKLIVAPANMRPRFLELIEREVAHARSGRPARIVAKMNSLEDRRIICALYAASRAGVEIDLIVRGFCSLRPGVPGLSDRVRVISVIGRFLEHSRVFYFANGKADPLDGEFYIGSADWMYRNLLARVEVVTPIEDRPLRERCWEVLELMLRDHRQAWDMRPDGSYVQRRPRGPEDVGTQQALIQLTRQRAGLRGG